MSMTFADIEKGECKNEYEFYECIEYHGAEFAWNKLSGLNNKIEILEEALDVNARVYERLLKDYQSLKLKCEKYRNQTL